MTQHRRYVARDVDGILLLDKPLGISSNAALQRAKRIFRASKAGHTGNLDVLATGVLPVCFGDATKVSSYLLDADKAYRTTVQLGSMTLTGDSEGEVVKEMPIPPLDEQSIQTVLDSMLGTQQQVPPMFSALKHQGQPLYKLARKGIEIERQPRSVQIYSIECLGFTADSLDLDVSCSKGTYIRTLVEDIGVALGTCAHVSALRRTRAGQYRLQDCSTLEQLQERAERDEASLDDWLRPVDSALEHLPALYLKTEQATAILQGQSICPPEQPITSPLRLYRETGQFLGIGRVKEDGCIAPRRLMRIADPGNPGQAVLS